MCVCVQTSQHFGPWCPIEYNIDTKLIIQVLLANHLSEYTVSLSVMADSLGLIPLMCCVDTIMEKPKPEYFECTHQNQLNDIQQVTWLARLGHQSTIDTTTMNMQVTRCRFLCSSQCFLQVLAVLAISLVIVDLSSSAPRPAPQFDITDNLIAPWAVAIGLPALSAAAVATVGLIVISRIHGVD